MNSNDLFSNKPLNILKAAIPYVPGTMQKIISYYIKIEELNIMRNSFNASPDSLLSACDYNSENSAHNNPAELLNAVKPYLNNEEKNLIDMFMNMVTAFNMYNTCKTLNMPVLHSENADVNSSDNQADNFEHSNTEDAKSTTSTNNNLDIDALKNMLSPSQRAMFDTYSSILNKKSV